MDHLFQKMLTKQVVFGLRLRSDFALYFKKTPFHFPFISGHVYYCPPGIALIRGARHTPLPSMALELGLGLNPASTPALLGDPEESRCFKSGSRK